MNRMNNPDLHNVSQLVTRWADAERASLVTRVERRDLSEPTGAEVLVEPLWAPLHGSFWLAVHPEARHPRIREFMAQGRFVFGNGGVARVKSLGPDVHDVVPGDLVAVFGHHPCSRPDCEACRLRERFTECEYGEAGIIGHGKHSPDGLLGERCVLPAGSYALCAPAAKAADPRPYRPYMFTFLVADVLNALSRDPETFARERVLIVGAGLSGQLAAKLILTRNPAARVFGVDVSQGNASAFSSIEPGRTKAVVLDCSPQDAPGELDRRMREHFGGKSCNLLAECSSGHTAPLWANATVLRPGTHCVLFGFGLHGLSLDPGLLQLSGLRIQTSRGVGDGANRRKAVALMADGLADFVDRMLLPRFKALNSLTKLEEIVRENHKRGTMLVRNEDVYVCPNGDPDAKRGDRPASSGLGSSDIAVALLLYNRPRHSMRVLESLIQNGARRCHAFMDKAASRSDLSRQRLIREAVENCQGMEIILHDANEHLGLARSVRNALDTLMAEHKAVVLLEDDCVLRPGALRYFTEGLTRLERDKRIRSICGHGFAGLNFKGASATGLLRLRRFFPWGWATWRDRWRDYQPALPEVLRRVREAGVDLKTLAGDLARLCRTPAYLNGEMDIWSLSWALEHYATDTFSVYPGETLIDNIGCDGSGRNCKKTDVFAHTGRARSYMLWQWEGLDYHPENEAMLERFLREAGPLAYPLHNPDVHDVQTETAEIEEAQAAPFLNARYEPSSGA